MTEQWIELIKAVVSMILVGATGIICAKLFVGKKDKLEEALKYAQIVKQFIVGFFAINPEAKVRLSEIAQKFFDKIQEFIPLTAEEVETLWNAIANEIVKALKAEGVEVITDTVKVNYMLTNLKVVNKPKQNLLFK